ncbi:MAG: signal peptidase I [Spirochaetales bacterium]|nr:signal peptidase I [Spirochaetales bacterium]
MIRAEAHRIRRKKGYGTKIWKVLRVLLLAFVILALVKSFLLTSIVIGSDADRVHLFKGDRLLATPLLYGAKLPYSEVRFSKIISPQRGDLVVFDSRKKTTAFPFSLFDGLLGFFSLGFLGGPRDDDGRRIEPYLVKRVIGVPGDQIYIDRFKAYIKPADTSDFVDESQIVPVSYTVNIDENYFIPDWKDGFPYSGQLKSLSLEEGQYFLLGDDRTASLDSLSLGPVTLDQIESRVFFRFWPLNRFGYP